MSVNMRLYNSAEAKRERKREREKVVVNNNGFIPQDTYRACTYKKKGEKEVSQRIRTSHENEKIGEKRYPVMSRKVFFEYVVLEGEKKVEI